MPNRDTHEQADEDDAPPTCCAFLFGRGVRDSASKPLSNSNLPKSHTTTKKSAKAAKTALDLIFQSSSPDPEHAALREADAIALAEPSASTHPPKPMSVEVEIRERLGWELGKVLGSGHFATVKLGRRIADGKLAAVKVLERAKSEKDRLLAKKEMEILMRVDHPYCVRCYDTFETETRLYLFMELMEGGELFDAIVAKGHYAEKDAQDVTYKLLSALSYLHKAGIVHRDLKPENMLLTSAGPDAQVKIADFGLGKMLDAQSAVMQTACGTPGYIAPEVLRRKGYGASCDIWSLGVIVYILLCGFPPFYADNDAQLFKKIKAGQYEFIRPYWDPVSALAKDFVAQMLLVDPSARPDADALMEHGWLQAQRAGDLVRQRSKERALEAAAVEEEAAAAAAAVVAEIDPHQHFQRQLTSATELSKLQARRRLKAAFEAAMWAGPAPHADHA